MLSYEMPIVQQNAAAYLQHLCFNNDKVKEDVRKLGELMHYFFVQTNAATKTFK